MAELLHFPVPAPPPTSSQPPDADARSEALDIRRSFVVEAPAGSGKTGLLIQRYLKLLTDPAVTDPEQVLALTFTTKATAEMRERVLGHLQAATVSPAAADPAEDFAAQTLALARAVLARDRQLAWNLLDRPGRLNIRTIDSACARIANTLPVLSRSGGRLAPVLDAGPLFHDAARRTLLLLGSGDGAFDRALRDILLHRDNNLADCESLLAEMLSLRDQWGELVPLTRHELDDAYLDAHVLPRLQRALEEAICAGLTQLARVIPAEVLERLSVLAGHLGHADGYKGAVSPIAICAGLHTAPGETAEHLERWRALIHLLTTKDLKWRARAQSNFLKFEIAKAHAAQLNAILDSLRDRDDVLEAIRHVQCLPPAEYPADQWRVARSLFRVLTRALVELQLVFAERGQCDFTETSLFARHALRDDGGAQDLAAGLGYTLQHLLVDEMQDTSTSQYELIQLLTASWDGHGQTVFLVGDPRQSIYLFRQARVERFLRTMRTGRLGDLPLSRLRLTANFRSQRTLVEQFNHTFSAIFPQDASAAEPTLPASPQSVGLRWHTQVVPKAATPEMQPQLCRRYRREDAAEIARIAREWIAKPLPPNRSRNADGRPRPWQLAVLVRSRGHLTEIVSAFQRATPAVPFRAVDIEPLGERQEILDLTALTRALLHPADRVAALAVLHGPCCGLSLADLHTLTGADDPAWKRHPVTSLMELRGHLLPDDACERMRRVWSVLTVAANQRNRLTTAQLVERAWRSLGGDAPLGPAELTNARRFFELLDEMTARGEAIDAVLLNDRLHRLFAEPASFSADTPFVELLTIHKAKGLEWDVVFVPALESTVRSERDRLLTWSELDVPDAALAPEEDGAEMRGAPIMLAPIAGRGEASKALNTWLRSLEGARQAAERKRLFYVVCTRARLELHLFATPEAKVNGEPGVPGDSLLKAAWPAAKEHLDAARMPPAALTPQPAVLDLAASAPTALATYARPILRRLPLDFDAALRLAEPDAVRLPYGDGHVPKSLPASSFSRPEGSFAARSFGNAVHVFLEALADRIAAGAAPAGLSSEVASWTPRIAAILRASGLPVGTVDRLAPSVRTALSNTLRDPDGLWLLAQRAGAASEATLTTSELATIRIDRLFVAGAEPHGEGTSHLWIVDYKTSSHAAEGLDDFLARERTTYAPQLEHYARILSREHPRKEIQLALYFPAIPRLLWWSSNESTWSVAADPLITMRP